MTQLRNGDCTPFLGTGACYPALPADGDLSAEWADRYGYPFPESARDLPRVMQYAATVERDPIFVKGQVREALLARGYPNLGDATQAHGLLARLPLAVYVTTSYDDFMVTALRQEGRQPRALVCPWDGQRPDADAPDTELGPADPDRPVVFHLQGSLAEARSMVLTEDDHLDFMATLAENRTTVSRMIPTSVIAALKNRPLLFVGYSFEDWTFRMLLHGVLRTLAPVHLRRHVSVQLTPSPNGDGSLETQVKAYFERYFDEKHVTVFWGSTSEFCIRLMSLLALT